MKNITSKELLVLAGTTEKDLTDLGLDINLLIDVYTDFLDKQDELNKTAEMISNTLMRSDGVHSVRFRVKDPVHLIKKIIRKKKDNPDRLIDVTSYLYEVTDLIGVRVLHLYKEAWHVISQHISKTWDMKEDPIAYYRAGDTDIYIQQFKQNGCQVKEHNAGYRSVHFIIETKPNKQKYYAEIQVRTIFEEGWSEIDHDIRYPSNLDNTLINNFLQTLNRLSGSADELGTFIRRLESDLASMEEVNKETLKERDKTIAELKASINKLSINKPEKDALNTKLSNLVTTQIKFPYPSGLSALFNTDTGIAAMMGAVTKVNNMNTALSVLGNANEASVGITKAYEVSSRLSSALGYPLNGNITKEGDDIKLSKDSIIKPKSINFKSSKDKPSKE